MTFHQIRHYLGLSREQMREQMPSAIELAIVLAVLIAIAVAASLAGFPELGIVAVGLVNVGWWVAGARRRRKRRGPGTST